MPAKHWSAEPATVRQRFALGVILIATAYAAVLLGITEYFGMNWAFPAFVAGGCLWVGLAQALLYRLKKPRAVSMVAGLLYYGAWLLLVMRPFLNWTIAIEVLLSWTLLGSLLGYIAGILVSSIFLLNDLACDLILAKRIEEEALQKAMGESPASSPWDE